MLVDFTRRSPGAQNCAPDVPVCSKTDVLIKDGRNYAQLALEISRQTESLNTGKTSVVSDVNGGSELLLQLL